MKAPHISTHCARFVFDNNMFLPHLYKHHQRFEFSPSASSKLERHLSNAVIAVSLDKSQGWKFIS